MHSNSKQVVVCIIIAKRDEVSKALHAARTLSLKCTSKSYVRLHHTTRFQPARDRGTEQGENCKSRSLKVAVSINNRTYRSEMLA